MAFRPREHTHEHCHVDYDPLRGDALEIHTHKHDHSPRDWVAHVPPSRFPAEGPEHGHEHAEGDPDGRSALRDREGTLSYHGETKSAEADRLRRMAAAPGTPELLTKAYHDQANAIDPGGDPALRAHSTAYYENLATITADPSLSRGYRELAARRAQSDRTARSSGCQ